MNSYCCDKKCFLAPELQYDGVACTVCESFSFCCCKCKTYTKYIYVIDEKPEVHVGFFLPMSMQKHSIKFLIPEYVIRNRDVISGIKETIKVNTSMWKSVSDLKK